MLIFRIDFPDETSRSSVIKELNSVGECRLVTSGIEESFGEAPNCKTWFIVVAVVDDGSVMEKAPNKTPAPLERGVSYSNPLKALPINLSYTL